MFGEGRPDNQDGASKPEGDDDTAAPGSQARTRGRPARQLIVIGVATAAIIAAGIGYAVTQGPSAPSLSVQHAAQPAGPLRVTSVTPAGRSTGVDGASVISVTFSAPVAAKSPDPVLQPSVPGTWTVLGDSMIFTPSQAFSPTTRVTLQIPAGPQGVRSQYGGLLATPVTDYFTTGAYPQLALAELLAEQGYLPVTFNATQDGATRAEQADVDADAANLTAAGQAYDPAAGTFAFDSGYPGLLQSMWTPDQANVLLRGAVMAFDSEHHMTIDGNLTPQFWTALFKAQQLGEQNQNGYTYAIANKGSPETLTIWHNGQLVMRTLANTGIPVSPTVDGTFPVYQRFLFQIMRGTNPDGSSYADPVSFVSYFNGGDAVHYFPRPGYGYEQSLGCVELPYSAAEQAYPYLTYGSLVSVTG